MVIKRESRVKEGIPQDEVALCVFQGRRQRGREEMKIQVVKENVERIRFRGTSEENYRTPFFLKREN